MELYLSDDSEPLMKKSVVPSDQIPSMEKGTAAEAETVSGSAEHVEVLLIDQVAAVVVEPPVEAVDQAFEDETVGMVDS